MASLIKTLSRRRFLAASGAAATLVAATQRMQSRANQLTEYGDCVSLPAIAWYRHFVKGEFLDIPYEGLNDGRAYEGWQMTESPDLGPYFIPNGWTTDIFFANQFERDGLPIWQETAMPHPRWEATMVTSPQQDAFHVRFVGRLDGLQFDGEGGALFSRHLAIGTEAESKSICLMEQFTPSSDLPITQWLSGEHIDDLLLMSNGQGIFADFGGMNNGPGSAFTINVLVCPLDESEEYMSTVFIPILWQFVPRGSGGEETTPTPSPTP